MVGGTFLMGSDDHYPEEAPAHPAIVPGFWIDKTPVTNLRFEHFVRDTGYVTLAEREPRAQDYPGAAPKKLAPGSLVFRQPEEPVDLRSAHWWEYVSGANWRHPEGPGSSIAERKEHPVVHVAYEDALAFAKWAGKSLPNEAEWEFAARGGLHAAVFGWGDDPAPNGRRMTNIWTGEFPWQNLKPDRPGTERVESYPANGYRLYDMIGNVWEWTSDWYRARHGTEPRKRCCVQEQASGATGDKKTRPSSRLRHKVLKGGSFLCAENYCFRFRPAARQPQSMDSSTCHIGFRCIVREPESPKSRATPVAKHRRRAAT